MCAFQWTATIFSATGETLHKHKFAFNASLLRFVKRTLERIPCFVVFFFCVFCKPAVLFRSRRCCCFCCCMFSNYGGGLVLPSDSICTNTNTNKRNLRRVMQYDQWRSKLTPPTPVQLRGIRTPRRESQLIQSQAD